MLLLQTSSGRRQFRFFIIGYEISNNFGRTTHHRGVTCAIISFNSSVGGKQCFPWHR